MILDWKKSRGGFRPARLSLDGWMESRSSPTESKPPSAVAIRESHTDIRVMHDGRTWPFTKGGNGWHLDP